MRPKVIVTGGSGFLATTLAGHLAARFHVRVLTRSPTQPHHIHWDGVNAGPWTRELESAHALINFAGRSVNCRYTARNRRRMMDSRLLSTRVLARAVAACSAPPKIWLNSSTATIYRHTFGPAWTESGEIAATPEARDAFSIDLAAAWEHEFFSPPLPHIRRVALRTAIVFGTHPGTVFPILRTLARFALAGRMGDGRQWVSWIHQLDFVRAVEFILGRDDLIGPVNVAAPNPISNAVMMRTFRELAGVNFSIPSPRWLLEIAAFFHRTETELLIKSRHVIPGKLVAAGFEFQFPEFATAMRQLADLIRVAPVRKRILAVVPH
jgi:uncharacterized protein (TIGR01777 family)